MKLKTLLAIVYASALTVGAPSAAWALDSTKGANYSRDTGSFGSKTMTACDMVADSRHVYADFEFNEGEFSDVADGNGANNGCASRGTYIDIIAHRTCVAIDFAPDSCGYWVYP